MRLIFATNNPHKLLEYKNILSDKYKDIIFSMDDLDIHIDPEENGNSFLENANIKSLALYNELKKHSKLMKDDYIIADDTGLCIDFFDGAPGIKSARFMGKETNQAEKNDKIVFMMKDLNGKDRSAHFITTLSIIKIDNLISDIVSPMIFEGRIDGFIAKAVDGHEGFGYDPIFAVGDPLDEKNGITYSAMGQNKKNKISHRAKAINSFVLYLEKCPNI